MSEYIVVLAEKDAEALGQIRCFPGLQAAAREGHIWLRGIVAKTQPPVLIRQLPALQTFLLGPGEQLFPIGGLTPTSLLPPLDWQALPAFLPAELPVSALPGSIGERVPLRIVASGRAEKGAALLTGWPVWAAYVEKAPAVRLQGLRFAASERSQALITGDILPPLPGREYWLQAGLLLPAGFDFEFPVLAELIRKKYNPENATVLIFDENGAFEKIDRNLFAPATRSAIRMTQIR